MHKICNFCCCNSLLSTSTASSRHRHDRQRRKRRRRSSVIHVSSDLLLIVYISLAGILSERIAIVYATSSQHNNNTIRNSIASSVASYNNNKIQSRISSAAFVDTKKSIHSSNVKQIPSVASSYSTSSSTALSLKFKTFDEMIQHHHSTPILIDFYSPVCGPCKLMKMELKSIKGRLDKLHTKHSSSSVDGSYEDDYRITSVATGDGTTPSAFAKGGIPVYHVNTNKFPQVGVKNKINGLPTLVLFHEGQELWRNEGMISGGEIVRTLESILNK